MHLVKIIRNDDGDKVEKPVWCAVVRTDGDRTFCSEEVFGKGEGVAEYKEKFSGKVNCPRCIKLLNYLKQYKY